MALVQNEKFMTKRRRIVGQLYIFLYFLMVNTVYKNTVANISHATIKYIVFSYAKYYLNSTSFHS